MNTREIASFSSVWNKLLTRINETNLTLQKKNIDLETVVNLYDSLIEFVNYLRNSDEVFTEIEEEGEKLSHCTFYQYDTKRKPIRKRQYLEPDNEVTLNGSNNFKFQTFYVILDVLNAELVKRKVSYQEINNNFNFLFNLDSIDDSEIREKAKNLVGLYPTDLDNSFLDESIQFKEFINKIGFDKNYHENSNVEQMLNIIISNNVSSTFNNTEICLRMYNSIAVTNCTGERSFSVLARVKNYLRSTQADDRLTNLSILNIEKDMLEQIDDNDIISKFANSKSRKVFF